MAASVLNSLSLVLSQQDATLNYLMARTIGPVSYTGTVGESLIEGTLADTAAHVQTLPTANVLQFYFKNTHATAVITVTATVQGGSSQVVKKVQPGGVVVAWDPVTSATAGYTALTLTSDTSGATFEMFLGG